VAIKTVTLYETSDGRRWETETQARAAEKGVLVRKLLRDLLERGGVAQIPASKAYLDDIVACILLAGDEFYAALHLLHSGLYVLDDGRVGPISAAGQPLPCGSCGKTGHMTGTCPVCPR
jgi:hypothetical protein